MKKNKLFKLAIGLFSAILLMNSCVKDGEDLVGTAGSSLVKFFPGDFNMVAINATNVSQTALLCEIRRDVKSEAAMNTPASATLKFDVDGTMLTAYNEKLVEDWMAADTSHTDPADYDGPVFEALPKAFYTTDPPTAADGTITVNFAAGEFAKPVMVTVPDATKFDFSASYGVPYQLVSVSGEAVKSLHTSDILVCQVLAKNKYDGKYKATGTAIRENDPVLSGLFKDEVYVLATTGSNSVKANRVACWSTGAGIGGIDIWTYNVDPTTNKVTIVDNVNAAVKLLAGYDHRYDPVTKTIYVSVYWGTGPNNRAWRDVALKYTGPR